ncbi:AAA family ATPase [Mycobacteroides franklinii]|uniref:AAA family ATPase n=1 Tax=Mycobacteroides franklinii TaxID=948102 RepID=A0A4R5PDP3_9MYCO|nr:AAA family ATPase [Mycobacteroides franklinii]TDH23170.1 AAA family ATPase [Mycobacteroides franklinii]
MATIDEARRALSAAYSAAGFSVSGRPGSNPPDKALARKLFMTARKADPAMADAWLGMVQIGDGRSSTYEQLAANASRIGTDLSHLGLNPAAVGARVQIDDYVAVDLIDAASADLAWIAAMVNEGNVEASETQIRAAFGPAGAPKTPTPPTTYDVAWHLLTQRKTPQFRYLQASLATRVKRWDDVLAAVGDAKDWPASINHELRFAALQLAAQAAAWLGLTESAVDDAKRAASDGTTVTIAADAKVIEALVYRYQGKEADAESTLTDVVARFPDTRGAQHAREALNDKNIGLLKTDTQTIASRTDRWDPATETTAAQREENKAASAAKELVEASETRLKSLIGQEAMKTEMRLIRADVKVTLFRSRKGLEAPPPSQHAIFNGPPGTGKTESATSFAEWLCGYRLIRSPEPLVFRRETVVGEHLGESEANITRLITRAIDEGRMLFCDEFQEMFQEGMSGGDAFGNAVLSGLMAAMENERHQLVVVVAGYKRGVEKVLSRNDGMRSRFAAEVPFVGFDPGELLQITDLMAGTNQIELHPTARDYALQTYTTLYNHSGYTQYGDEARGTDLAANGRYVRNLMQRAKKIHSARIEEKMGEDFDWDDAEAEIDPILLKTVVADDIYDAIPAVTTSELRTVLGR